MKDERRMHDLVRDAYTEVRFSESARAGVREKIRRASPPAPDWFGRVLVTAAAVALFVITANLAVLLVRPSMSGQPRFIVSTLPQAAISYQEDQNQ